MKNKFVHVVLTGLVALLPIIAQAHTALKTSTPADAATVTTIPASIQLEFTAPVRLIKVEVMGVGHEMPTEFKPGSEALASYTVTTPNMHPGEFTVNWSAIGEDGHTISNSFSFVVDPAASDSAP